MKVLVVVFVLLLAGIPAWGQNPKQSLPAPTPASGFTGYETIQGSIDSFGGLFKIDSSAGYDFNRNVGVFVGVPLYFTHDFNRSTSSTRIDGSGAGDLYFGIEYMFLIAGWIILRRSPLECLRETSAKDSAPDIAPWIGIINSSTASRN